MVDGQLRGSGGQDYVARVCGDGNGGTADQHRLEERLARRARLWAGHIP